MSDSDAYLKLQDAMSGLASELSDKAETADTEDLRRSQLQARQDEQVVREEEKAKRKSEKNARPPPQPKKRGRPRKVEEAPAEGQEAGENGLEDEEGAGEEPEEVEEEAEEEAEKSEPAAPEDGSKPRTPQAPSRKKRSTKAALDDPAQGHEAKKSRSGKGASAKKRTDGVNVDEEPAPKQRRSCKVKPQEEPAEVAESGSKGKKPKAKAKAKASAKGHEENPSGRNRRKKFQKMVEDVQEVNESLAQELSEVISANDAAFKERERVREFFPGNNSKSMKVVYYWDRNAVGIKVLQGDGTWPQICYFQLPDVETIQAATILAKRMWDRIILKGADWVADLPGAQFEQVLKNSGAHALRILAERSTVHGQ